MGLRLLVPPKTFWDCDYSSHRKPCVEEAYYEAILEDADASLWGLQTVPFPLESRIFPPLWIEILIKWELVLNLFNMGYSLTKIQKKSKSEGRTRRLLQEQRKVFDGASNRSPTCPKTPQEAFFADEEAEAVPAESEVFCRSEYQHSINIRMRENVTKSSFHYVAISLKCKSQKIHKV